MAERKARVAEGGDATKATETAAAAPLEAPVAKPTRVDVTQLPGDPNAVAPVTAFTADNTVRLLDADGNSLTVDDLFEYPTAEKPGTLAKVTTRVYREFRHPGTTKTSTTQLLYPKGALVSIFEAERVKSEYRDRSASAE